MKHVLNESEMKNFNISEFDSPDLKGSGKNMQESTLIALDNAREIAGIPFLINSGYRTRSHNKKVNGVSDSSHLHGYAVDIRAIGSWTRMRIVSALMDAGFNRIGIGKKFVHADNDPNKIQNVIWLYR